MTAKKSPVGGPGNNLKSLVNSTKFSRPGQGLDKENVRNLARGRWPEFLGGVGIGQGFLSDRHGPCPLCGGSDRFRFDNLNKDGTYFCSQCGPGDGFSLAEKFLGKSFQEALEIVANFLGCLPVVVPEKSGDVIDFEALASQGKAAQAAEKTAKIWSEAEPAPENHGYFLRKNVKPHGLGLYRGPMIIAGMTCDNSLIIPLSDETGKLQTLEFISESGEKRFLPGGRKKGSFFAIGEPSKTIVICEGFSTAGTVHEATRFQTVMAVDSGNLLEIAEKIAKLSPGKTIIIAADDDRHTSGNPGLTKASDAARRTGAKLATPDFGHLSGQGNASDFNDMARLFGLEAVRRAILAARQPEAEPQGANDEKKFSTTKPAFEPKSCFELGMLGTEPAIRKTIVADMLPANRVGGLIAQGGSGKSSLGCLLGASVAAGRNFLDRETTQGSVLVVGAEDEQMEFHRRLKRITRNWPQADQEKTYRNLYFESRTGARNLLTENSKEGEVGRTVFADQLIESAKLVDNLSLIILDPGSRFRGGEENSSEDTTRFVEALEYVSIETDAAILLVHHANKASSQRKYGDQNSARGSSALVDGLRFVFSMAALNDEEIKRFGIPLWQAKEIICFSCAKTNYFKKFDDIYLDLSSGIEKIKLVEQIRVKVSQTLGAEEAILEIIKEYAEKGIRFTRRAFCDSFSGKKKKIGMSKNDLDIFLLDMVSEGNLAVRAKKQGTGEVLYTPGDPALTEDDIPRQEGDPTIDTILAEDDIPRQDGFISFSVDDPSLIE
ncbi:MAG: putative superfamily II helicase [Magnetococcales bacterium]|nr:putative superfamily II helicase [Magnetococcales bacterium]